MNKLLIFFYILTTLPVFSQVATEDVKIKVFMVKDHKSEFLIAGIREIGGDSIFFISLKDTAQVDVRYKKIEPGNSYQFHLRDVDNLNGHLPSAFPNGFWVRIGSRRLKRDGRNGRTLTTTQYFAENTNGAYVFESNSASK